MSNNKTKIDAVRVALAPARLATYEVAAGVNNDEDLAALELYAWNATVSGALLAPLHICEVSLRNTVADALEAVYGPRWPWEPVFERSLPNPSENYNPKKDLILTRAMVERKGLPTTGKVIPELKFVFWQKMFTGRHDARLWDHHLLRVMPNLDVTQPVSVLRLAIYNEMEQVRKLRNRIAHHEPIFTRNLTDDYEKILALVTYRCSITAAWMNENQLASNVIAEMPQRLVQHGPAQVFV